MKRLDIDEKDMLDLRICFQTINTANEMLDRNPGFSLLTEKQMSEFLSGVCEVLISAKVSLHKLRKELSEKYKIDYDFMFDGEHIIIE
jgi:hypothetical protein